MDETLRAYARKRRAETNASFEPHPATRRLLLGEAKRVHPPVAASAPKANLMRAFWLRIGLGFAACAIFVGVLFLYDAQVHPPGTSSLAFNDADGQRTGEKAQAETALPPGSASQPMELESKPEPVSADTFAPAGTAQRSRDITPPTDDARQKTASATTATVAMDALTTAPPGEGALASTRSGSKEHAFGGGWPPAAEAPASPAGAYKKSAEPATVAEAKRAAQVPAASAAPVLLTRAEPAKADRTEVLAVTNRLDLVAAVKTAGTAGGLAEKSFAVQDKALAADRTQPVGRDDAGAATALAAKEVTATVPSTPPSSAALNGQALAKAENFRTGGEAARLLADTAETEWDADGTAAVGYRFAQVDPAKNYRRNLQSPAPPSVLRQFQFTRTGSEVRLTDADGSVYAGTFLASEEAAARKDVPAERRQKPGALLAPAAPGGDAFRVTGTNRAGQSIVIEGRLLAAAVPVAAKATAKQKALVAGKKEAEALGDASIVPAPATFEATLTIGGTNTFQIRAVPVP